MFGLAWHGRLFQVKYFIAPFELETHDSQNFLLCKCLINNPIKNF